MTEGRGETSAAGAILAEGPCPPSPPYGRLDEFGRRHFEARTREIATAAGDPLQPRCTGGFGRIDALTLADLRPLSQHGFVVAATDLLLGDGTCEGWARV